MFIIKIINRYFYPGFCSTQKCPVGTCVLNRTVRNLTLKKKICKNLKLLLTKKMREERRKMGVKKWEIFWIQRNFKKGVGKNGHTSNF